MLYHTTLNEALNMGLSPEEAVAMARFTTENQCPCSRFFVRDSTGDQYALVHQFAIEDLLLSSVKHNIDRRAPRIEGRTSSLLNGMLSFGPHSAGSSSTWATQIQIWKRLLEVLK